MCRVLVKKQQKYGVYVFLWGCHEEIIVLVSTASSKLLHLHFYVQWVALQMFEGRREGESLLYEKERSWYEVSMVRRWQMGERTWHLSCITRSSCPQRPLSPHSWGEHESISIWSLTDSETSLDIHISKQSTIKFVLDESEAQHPNSVLIGLNVCRPWFWLFWGPFV